MAESFSNKLNRSVGSSVSKSGATIGITTDTISGITTASVLVGDLVVNQNFLGGTKVSAIGAGQVTVDKNSTNTASTSSQSVNFLGVTTVHTATQKEILVAGTFANLSGNSIDIYVEVFDNSESVSAMLANEIPIPNGSSFVLSDAGKTVLETSDEVRFYCDTNNAVDVTLSILGGVN